MAESQSENGAASSSAIYVNELADVQTYLEQLHQLVTECAADDGDDVVLDQFADREYLAALRVQQRQLDAVRDHATRNPADPTSSLLIEMLDVVEPLCHNMIQTLAGVNLEPRVTGSASEPAADAQLSTTVDLLVPLERVSVERSTDVATTDVTYSGEDVARHDETEAQASVAGDGHGSAATDDASARNVSPAALPVLLDQAPVQLLAADIQVAAATANPEVSDMTPDAGMSRAVVGLPVLPVPVDHKKTQLLSHADKKRQKQERAQQTEDDDYTSFVVISSSEVEHGTYAEMMATLCDTRSVVLICACVRKEIFQHLPEDRRSPPALRSASEKLSEPVHPQATSPEHSTLRF